MGIRTSCVGPALQAENSKGLLDTYCIQRDKAPRWAPLVIPREKHNRHISQFFCQMEKCVCALETQRNHKWKSCLNTAFYEQEPEKQKHSELMPNSLEATYPLFQGKRVKKVLLKLPQFVGNSGMVAVYLT